MHTAGKRFAVQVTLLDEEGTAMPPVTLDLETFITATQKTTLTNITDAITAKAANEMLEAPTP
jgi:hypothetical protein